jgi:hypothetical protein
VTAQGVIGFARLIILEHVLSRRPVGGLTGVKSEIFCKSGGVASD